MNILRVAVRKFDPFEKAIVRQFEDFVRRSGVTAGIEIEAMDLNPLHEALFERRDLATGRFENRPTSARLSPPNPRNPTRSCYAHGCVEFMCFRNALASPYPGSD